MSVVHRNITGLDCLERGLNNLRNSKMMIIPEFRDMFYAVEHHYRDLRQTHLTGKTNDLLVRAENDTKFYNILVKMLCEIRQDHNIKKQMVSIRRVYAWFLANKHVLYSGPIFGNTTINKLKKSSITQKLLNTSTVQTQRHDPAMGNENIGVKETNSYTELMENFYNTKSEIDLYNESKIEVAKMKSKVHGNNYELPSVKSEQSDIDEIGRPKMIHSITSIVNPHADLSLTLHSSEELIPISQDQKKTMKSRKGDTRSSQKQAEKANAESYSSHQRSMSRQQMQLQLQQQQQQGLETQQQPHLPDEHERVTGEKQQDDPFQDQSLEEFYEKTAITYPFTARKRPATQQGHTAKCSRKTMSAPVFSIGDTSGRPCLTTKSDKGRQLRSTIRSPSESNLNMDTIVTMIDSVSQEMVLIREQWVPSGPVGSIQPMSHRSISREYTPQPGTNTPVTDAEDQPLTPSPTEEDILFLQSRPQSEMVTQILSPSYRPTEGVSRGVSPARSRPQPSGAITPDTTRYKWSKTKFGGHTYLKKHLHQRQSLRSPGILSDGSSSTLRPNTAPVFNQNVKPPKTSDKNRIAQAASHTTRSVDQDTVDSMMHIKHLLGTSNDDYDTDYDEFDGDFMHAVRTLSHSVAEAQPMMEYVSFVTPSQETRSVPGVRGNIYRNFALSDNLVDSISSRTDRLDEQDIYELEDELRDLCDEDETQAEDDHAVNLLKQESESVHDDDESRSDIHIEVTAIPSSGRGPAPAKSRIAPLQPLSHSEQWTFSPSQADDKKDLLLQLSASDRASDDDFDFDYGKVKRSSEKTNQESVRLTIDGSEPVTDRGDTHTHLVRLNFELPEPPSCSEYLETSPVLGSHYKADSKKLLAEDRRAEVHTAEVKSRSAPKTKPIVKIARSQSALSSYTKPTSHPEELYLDSRTKMTTRVERAAGRTPSSFPGSAASQVLRMSRRQNEYFKHAPPIRTPPSIPTPHSSYGSRSPRVLQMFNSGLEHQARKENRPRHYLQQVLDMCRSDGLRSAPPILERDEESLSVSLQVSRIEAKRKMPITSYDGGHPKLYGVSGDRILSKISTYGRGYLRSAESWRGDRRPPTTPSTPTTPLYRQGRPIAHYQVISDPDEEAKAIQKQQEAAAAVDIQRIFRGYVARGQYKKLLSEECERLELQQKAAVEIQRAYREHVHRKSLIEMRGTDKDMQSWSREYKVIQEGQDRQRKEKLNNISQKNAYNYHTETTKLAGIGPHVDVYSIWHPKKSGPTERVLYKCAVVIQKHVHGWLTRKIFDKLKRKIVCSGLSFINMVKEYKDMLIRVQNQHGRKKARTPFDLTDFDNYLEMRRRYECVFERKAFGGELELYELKEYFNECDLYPSMAEIEEAIDVVFHGHGLQNGRGLKKKEVLEVVFYIYVPKAAELEKTRVSTWMNPIIDGVEARRLTGSELVEKAPLSVCMNLVIEAKRARRQRENEELQKQTENKLKEESLPNDLSVKGKTESTKKIKFEIPRHKLDTIEQKKTVKKSKS